MGKRPATVRVARHSGANGKLLSRQCWNCCHGLSKAFPITGRLLVSNAEKELAF
jgi:hypothetical protein